MKYICELCGKTHKTVEEAIQCEINCQNERDRKAQLKVEKQKRLDDIKKMIDNFNQDYSTKYRIVDISYSSPFVFFHDF